MSTTEITNDVTGPDRDEPRVTGPDFADVYSQHLASVWRFVRARVPDHNEAHDVTSDVFVRAWRAWDRFDPGRGPVEPWLFTIAARTVTDWWRKRRPEPVDPSIVVERDRDTADGPEAAALGEELLVALAHALDGLSDREREGLALRFAARLSSEHVARVLGTSPDAAKQMLHRAIVKLRDQALDDRQRHRTGPVADLEGVIDDVLARGHVTMNDSELHGLLVHLAVAYDAPVPVDLSARVSDCVACEARGTTGADERDVTGRARMGGRGRGALTLSGLLAFAPVCLACVVPPAATLLAAVGLGSWAVHAHELSLLAAPVIAWLVFRGYRRHGQPAGFRLALAGAVALLVHSTFHVGWYVVGDPNAITNPVLRVITNPGPLFSIADVAGTALIVAGAAVNLVHMRRWRRLEMRRFHRHLAITDV